MEHEANQFETLFVKATEYVSNNLELTKLKAVQKTSSVVSEAASSFILLCIMALFAFVLNIGLGLWIGEMIGKIYYGFFVLSGFYILAGIIFYSFRVKWVKSPVTDTIIKTLSK